MTQALAFLVFEDRFAILTDCFLPLLFCEDRFAILTGCFTKWQDRSAHALADAEESQEEE